MFEEKKPTLSLVVLNYNGLQHLKEYFESVFAQTLMPDEVIMFDNLSTDGSREFVAKKFPKVKIITEDRFNTGTALGSNIGFAHTRGDFVIFQSNDLRLDKNCVKGLFGALLQYPSVGIVTSVLVNYYKDKKTGQRLIDNAGGMMDQYGFGMQNHPARRIKDIPETGEVFFTYGGSFIVRRKLFKKIAGFDNRFFTLNDDLDLSWRIRLLGYKVIYTKKSFVYHKVHATLNANHNRAKMRYWSERNNIRTYLKNSSLFHLIRTVPFLIFLLFGEMGYFLYRGRFALFYSVFRAVLWNLLYLPEILRLRCKNKLLTQKNNIGDVIVKKSFKLMLFKSFSKSI